MIEHPNIAVFVALALKQVDREQAIHVACFFDHLSLQSFNGNVAVLQPSGNDVAIKLLELAQRLCDGVVIKKQAVMPYVLKDCGI